MSWKPVVRRWAGLLIGAALAFAITWFVAQRLGQTPRQAEGWAWIVAIAMLLLGGAGGDGWRPRFAGLRERTLTGTEGGWGGRPERGRR